jgi:hypothetical protein
MAVFGFIGYFLALGESAGIEWICAYHVFATDDGAI